MKIKFNQQVESMQNWLDDDDKLYSVTTKFDANQESDSETAEYFHVVRDAEGELIEQHKMPATAIEKWFNRIVGLGYAEAVA